ncbi:MAG: hypothetical protein GY765_24120 [bacterium]|nr:hypothetical protein [bacterium]
MQQVVLGIKNAEKAKFLLDFLRQLDFVEIKQVLKGNSISPTDAPGQDDFLLNAPALSPEELDNIERISKESGHWKIEEF